MTTSDSDGFLTDASMRPKGGSIQWTQTDDGKRLRVALWPTENAVGTVLIFGGRSEFIEKYGKAAIDLASRGFACATVDWRGQGESDRLLENTAIGHIDRFDDYQGDVKAFLSVVKASDLPEPYFLLGHSMGGAIGLRSIIEGLDVRAAAFAAPMWGIGFSPIARPVVNLFVESCNLLGLRAKLVPWTNTENYVVVSPFEGNLLTNDEQMYQFLTETVKANPGIGLGGPSCGWLYEALKECRWLMTSALPSMPVIVGLGLEEKVVSNNSIRKQVKRWPSASLIEYPDCQHEIMMESPKTRNAFFDDCAQHFRSRI